MGREYVERFLAALGAELTAPREELDVAIASFVARATPWCAEFAVERRDVVTHAGEVLRGEPDPLGALASTRVDDLCLAVACLHGRTRALAELERRVEREVAGAMRMRALAPVAGQDVAQELMVKLLTGGPESHPKLEQYAARAPISSWLRVIALRMVDRLGAAPREQPTDDELLVALAGVDDEPEIAYLQETYRVAFKGAFQEALAGLSADNRALLRQHVLEGLGLEELATLHQVHRTTAWRWLTRVHQTLLEETKRLLSARLKLPRQELDEVLAIVEGNLDVSLTRILAVKQPPS